MLFVVSLLTVQCNGTTGIIEMIEIIEIEEAITGNCTVVSLQCRTLSQCRLS
jgi:hypothetical protein